jgi:cytoskeletal protein RodZ
VNESHSKPQVRWTEDRVERLLLKVFGDPPGAVDEAAALRRRSPWSHWALVATCAGLLALLAPVLMVSRDADNVADRSETPASAAEEELIVADASTTDEAESDESESDGL